MRDVVIVDSGGANLGSLRCALERLGAPSAVSSDPARIAAASHVVLPGAGAAADAMERLRHAGLAGLIAGLRQPVLGICLGMQLLFRASEEGPTECLGILPDTVRRLAPARGCPVPHMGWNQLRPQRRDPLLDGIGGGDYAYFVHSYAVAGCEATLADTEYRLAIAAVVRRGNFCGTQFHPERSGRTGARLLGNFLRL